METEALVAEGEEKRKLVKVGKVGHRRLKAGINVYTATMPVEQVPDLMDPRYAKKADF